MKMMYYDAETLIVALSQAIDQKCDEIRAAHREKRQAGIFLVLCAMVIMIPTIFVLLGISLVILLIPALFTAVAFLILSPILISQQGGRTCEQV